jgi:hypothetical protein
MEFGYPISYHHISFNTGSMLGILSRCTFMIKIFQDDTNNVKYDRAHLKHSKHLRSHAFLQHVLLSFLVIQMIFSVA